MFENMTYESILEDMLSRVSSEVDKREGSIIYDALAPAAFKLAETYFKLTNYVDLFFMDTTVGEYLDRKAVDYGITRKPASKSIRKVETNIKVAIGTRWGIEGLIYTIVESIDDTNYKAECNEAGVIGNLYSGRLDNIDNVAGASAELTDVLIIGSEIESDTNLRERVKQQFLRPAQDGNVAQYLKWATEYPGIGAARVFPLANGANTVKVSITNSNFKPAETTLVQEFQKYIDPESEGLGNGVAPIGSKVTISGGSKKSITVTANVTLVEGYSQVIGAEGLVESYLASIVFKKNNISYMRIGSALLDHQAIADINNLKINNDILDIPLVGEDIPVLEGLTLTIVS